MKHLLRSIALTVLTLSLLANALQAAEPENPWRSIPDEQWDEVRAFYETAAQGSIPREYIDRWRPYTTKRSERVGGLHVLPTPSPNPLPGVQLDADLLALGMVSVVDFGADPSGAQDSTAAIQLAVDFGRDHALATFFPPGTYTVSGTIKAWSLTRVGPSYEGGRIRREDYFVPVLVGSAAAADRPVIRLAEGSFPSYVETDRRFVLEFRNFSPPSANTFVDEHGNTRFRYELYPQRLSASERERFRENTPDHIGPEFRGIDIEIAANNAGASGLRFPTAETAGVGDVEIRFLGDGHVGFQGPPGGGSSTINMTIIGGRIGLDTTNHSEAVGGFPAVPNSSTGTQPTPVLTGLTLINQTELAVRSQVRGTLVGVGWRIKSQLNGPVIMLRHAWYGDPFSSSLALIDSTIEYDTDTPFGNVVIGRYGDVEDRNRSFSLDNVYVRNAEQVYIADHLPSETFAANLVGWHHIKTLAYERQPRDRSDYVLRERVWLDGSLHDTWRYIAQALGSGHNPPSDLTTRHLYRGVFPHFEVPGAVNVRDHGAIGDSVADDTAAFQAAISAATANGSHVVVVPRGYFKLSDTLDLPAQTKLIGINRQWSVITTSQADGVFGGAALRSDYPEGIPLIRTADSASADTVIAHLRLAVGYPIKAHNGWWSGGGPPDFDQNGAIPYEESMVEVYPLHWRSGGSSVVRECMFNPRGEFNFHFNLYDEDSYVGALFLNPLIRMDGNAGGRWYGYHFHGYYPFGEQGSLIRIRDNANPVSFYHLHAQHNTAVNLIEFDNAQHVSIYGIKTEHHKTLLHSRNSRHIRIFGHGGIATPAPGGQHYLFENTQDFLISAIGDEVQFGTDSSHGSGWSIMYFTNIENYLVFIDRHAATDYHPPFNERPILYQRGHPQSASPVGPLITHTLTVSSSGNGSISGPSHQVIAAGASSAVVSAVPAEGYSFAGWSGDYTGWENPLYLTSVQADMSISATFQTANDAPLVSIIHPQPGFIAYVGEAVVFHGSATDTEDGDLSASSQWSSNRDGVLGSGASLSVSDLSSGLHQIAYAATDSSGQTTTVTVLMYVQTDPLVVPSLVGTSPGTNTPWLPSRIRHPSLSYDGLVLGSGLSGQGSHNVFEVRQGAPGDGADLAFVLANDHYIGFTIQPDPGHVLNLDGATFRFAVSRENNAAAREYTVFTSVDGFSEGAAIATLTHPGPAADFITMTYIVSGSRFEGLTSPVELRIYPHNASWGRNLTFQDFALFAGSLAADASIAGQFQPSNPGGGNGSTWHVKPAGNNGANGDSEASAWQTLSHAIAQLQAGDTLLVHPGTYYERPNEYKNWQIAKQGSPGNYITIRRASDERPVLTVDTWNGLELWNARYVEIDGLEIVGLPDPASIIGTAENSPERQAVAQDPHYFGGGITIAGNDGSHHIRIRNCVVRQVGGNGIDGVNATLILIEGNRVETVAHRSDAGNSGISFVKDMNDQLATVQAGEYGLVIANNIVRDVRNMLDFKWYPQITDGNGIILDLLDESRSNAGYQHRTLIANNLLYANGGRGVHLYRSSRVDVVHNTTWMNLESTDLQAWEGELTAIDASDVIFRNNIAVARDGVRDWHIGAGNAASFTHNQVVSTRDDQVAIPDSNHSSAPSFVGASTQANADFRLAAGSPGIDSGSSSAPLPSTDLGGEPRPRGGGPDRGAYEFQVLMRRILMQALPNERPWEADIGVVTHDDHGNTIIDTITNWEDIIIRPGITGESN